MKKAKNPHKTLEYRQISGASFLESIDEVGHRQRRPCQVDGDSGWGGTISKGHQNMYILLFYKLDEETSRLITC